MSRLIIEWLLLLNQQKVEEFMKSWAMPIMPILPADANADANADAHAHAYGQNGVLAKNFIRKCFSL